MAMAQQHVADVLGRLEKNMLAKALPFMFTREPHEYQVSMKAMARKALEKQRLLEAEKQASAKREVVEKQAILAEKRDDVRRSEEYLAQRLQDASEKESEVVEAGKRIKDEEELHVTAQARLDKMSQDREVLQKSKEEVDQALKGVSQLVESGCENEKARDDAVNACLLHLLGASKVLQAAVPKALACEPSKRGPFAKRVCEEISTLLNEKSATKDASLRVDAEKFRRVSAEAWGAWAIMEQAKDGLRKAEAAKAEAEGSHHAAKVVCTNIQEAAVDAEKTVNYALSMQAIVDNLGEDVDKALSFLTDLEDIATKENTEAATKETTEEAATKETTEEAATKETTVENDTIDKENEVVAKRRKLEHKVETDTLTVLDPLAVANH